jgi:hypothetical protein
MCVLRGEMAGKARETEGEEAAAAGGGGGEGGGEGG